MNKWLIGTALALVILGGVTASSYNGLVSMNENVNVTTSEVQNQMQRQADLLPNMATIVTKYASHESETLRGIAEARAGVQSVSKYTPDQIANNSELQKQVFEAQAKMNQSFVKLQSIAENYPQLKADSLFKNLMSTVEGTQNRITVARQRNQESVRTYNAAVQKFPRVIFASIFGYKAKPYFEASEKGKETPVLKL